MSNYNKIIEVGNDLFLQTINDSTRSGIKTNSDSINIDSISSTGTIKLNGSVDIIDDGADLASLKINGVDITDHTHVDTPTIVTSTPYTVLASDYLITVRVTGASSTARMWRINMPSAQTLARKVYKITVEGTVGTDIVNGGRLDIYPSGSEKVGHKDVNFFMITQKATYEFHSVDNFEGSGQWGWKIENSHESQALYNSSDRVRVSSVGNETLANLIDGYTLDGKSLLAGDMILLKDQSTGTQNGVYSINESATPDRVYGYHVGVNFGGQHIFVHDGTANANKTFYCSDIPGSDIVDTDNLTFVESGSVAFPTKADVTQGTSLTTGVTANGTHGEITLYSVATVTANTEYAFVLTNSFITATSIIQLTGITKGNFTGMITYIVATPTSGSVTIGFLSPAGGATLGGESIHYTVIN